MTEQQKELARHALGLPNDKNESYRNHFNTERTHKEWVEMVEQGDAVMRDPKGLCGESVMFHLTLQGALAAREPGEHISREDAEKMRGLV